MTSTTNVRTRLSSPSAWQWFIIVPVALGMAGLVLVLPSLERKFAPLLVAAALMPFIVLIFGHAKQWLIALSILDIALQADIYMGFDESVATFGTVSGYNMSITTIALVVLYALWLIESLARLTPHTSRPGHTLLGATLPLLPYLLCGAFSFVVAGSPQLVSYQFWVWLQIFLLFVYVVSRMRTRGEIVFILAVVILSLAVESILMIGLWVTKQSFVIGNIQANVYNDLFGIRVGGTIGSPNGAASFLSLLMAPALGAVLAPIGKRRRLLAAAAFLLAIPALVSTGSRGGWITFGLAMTIFVAVALYRRWISLKVVAALLVSIGVVVLILLGPILTRLTSDDKGSAESRGPLNRLALSITEDHPIFGVGLNNFVPVMKGYLTPDFKRNFIYVVHNHYLLVLAETGIVGAACFAFFLLTVLKRGWQASQLNDAQLAPLGLGLFAGTAAQLLHMSVDVFYGRPQMQTFRLAAALLTAMLLLKRDEARQVEAA